MTFQAEQFLFSQSCKISGKIVDIHVRVGPFDFDVCVCGGGGGGGREEFSVLDFSPCQSLAL